MFRAHQNDDTKFYEWYSPGHVLHEQTLSRLQEWDGWISTEVLIFQTKCFLLEINPNLKCSSGTVVQKVLLPPQGPWSEIRS